MTDPDHKCEDVATDRIVLGSRLTGERTGECFVYVVDLKVSVLQDREFAEKNPQYKLGKPCVYVGMTGRTPEERFESHIQGQHASKYVRRYGKRLRQQLTEGPIPCGEAGQREPVLADELRTKGWAVWQK